MMTDVQAKEARMDKAASFIAEFEKCRLELRDEALQESLGMTIARLRELRDVQYLFDSGEKELIRLYDMYLPALLKIVQEAVRMETAGNYRAIVDMRTRLKKTLATFRETLKHITDILPQDEIDQANAEAKARKAKEELEKNSRQ
ncbi:MAG: hypothetical protein IKE68_01190 [Solobacterium sp.]|nr:hypothetical protein [Solobacterium sp.]